jgi:hypothetical protein
MISGVSASSGGMKCGGQRHFAVRDPSGGMLDVVESIASSVECQSAYERDALEKHLERNKGGSDAK